MVANPSCAETPYVFELRRVRCHSCRASWVSHRARHFFRGVGMEATKQCSKCREVKPLSEFSKDTTKRDGHSSRCKRCAVAGAHFERR